MPDLFDPLFPSSAPLFGKGPLFDTSNTARPDDIWGYDINYGTNENLLRTIWRTGDYAEQLLKSASDPDSYRKVLVSAFLADRTGAPMETVYGNFDTYSKNYFGATMPVRDTWSAIKDAYTSGVVGQKVSLATFRYMMGQDTPELKQYIDMLEQSSPDPDSVRRPWWGEFGKSTANLMSSMVENWKFTAPYAATFATPVAMVAAEAGPAAAVGAWFASFFKGLAYGSSVYTTMSEAGSLARTLMKQYDEAGVAPDVYLPYVRAVSIPVGLVNGFLETIEMKNLPGFSTALRAANGSILDEVRKAVSSGALAKLSHGGVSAAIKYGAIKGLESTGKSLLVEPVQEVTQQAVTDIGQAIGVGWMNYARGTKIPQREADEVFKELGDTWVQTVQAIVTMAPLGFASETLGSSRAAAKFMQDSVNTLSEQYGVNADLRKLMNDEKKQEAPKPLKIAPDTIHQPSGELNFTIKGTVASEDGASSYMLVSDTKSGEQRGHIKFAIEGDKVVIDDVVAEDQATKVDMVRTLAARYAGMDIEWNPQADEDLEVRDQLSGGKETFQPYTSPDPDAPVRDRVKTQIQNASAVSDQEAEYAVILTELAAKAKGMDLNSYVNQYFHEDIAVAGLPLDETTRRGATELLQQGKMPVGAAAFQVDGKWVPGSEITRIAEQAKVLLHYSQRGDFTDVAHELTHGFVGAGLTTSQQKAAETLVGGIPVAQWGAKEHEILAKAVEDHVPYLIKKIEDEKLSKEQNSLLKRIGEAVIDGVWKILTIGQKKTVTQAQAFVDELFGLGAHKVVSVRQQAQEQAPSTSFKSVDSPEFKQWFGDSKAVNESGRPLVVYHGTPDSRNIYDQGFKTPLERYTGKEDPSRAFFFTDSRPMAKSYADDHRAFDYQNAVPETLQTHLKMSNPKTIDWGGKKWRGTDETISQAKAEGYDSVIIKNVVDYYNGDGKPANVYVVFDPTQIKSVNNRGTWNAEDPRILFKATTETPEFKKWFGDWTDPMAFTAKAKGPVSFAVDKEGKPLVLYHSTVNDFDTFEVGRPTFNSNIFGSYETKRYAIFASPSSRFSAEFAGDKKGARTIPVYMNLKSPLDMRKDGVWDDMADEMDAAGYNGNFVRRGVDRFWQLLDDKDFVEWAKGAGYDGAIFTEEDQYGHDRLTYAAFSPEQVKSAIGNRGTFDPTNPSILFKATTETPEFKKWFGDSKVVDDEGKPRIMYSGHSNVEMYGDKYLPSKGTAGGFYSTSDPEIASNYSVQKFGNYEYYENGDEYRIAGKNGKYNKKLWQIQFDEAMKAKIDALAAERDKYDEPVYPLADMKDYIENNKGYDKDVRRWYYRGGIYDLQSIYEFYNNNGDTIYHSQDGTSNEKNLSNYNEFDKLLTALGLDWNSSLKSQPGVMAVYLKIENPLDTSKPFPADLMAALEKKAKSERVKYEGQHWTKDYSIREWVDEIKNDDGVHGWATQIPAKALPILKAFGYDGIMDTGGKMGGKESIIGIVFDSNQIKSATGNRGTFDASNPSILFKAEDMELVAPEEQLPADSPFSLFKLEKVEHVVTVRSNAPKAIRVYEVSSYPEQIQSIIGLDRPAEIELTSLDQAGKINANPDRIADWQQIYRRAMAIEDDPGRKLGFSDMKKVNKDGKLETVPVIALSKGCQRAQTMVERVLNGLMPSETSVEACYGGTCWVNRQFNAVFGTFENMEVRDLVMARPSDVDQWFKSKKAVEFLASGPFIREGQMGCSSHAFPILDGYDKSLAESWLENVRKAGITNKTVFITAAYAPVSDESYRRLIPYKDLFEIHVSVSGWFHRNELMVRLAEFQRIKDLGLPVAMRLVTNADNIGGLEMPNHDWVMQKIKEMKVDQAEVLETPYHDDVIKKGKDRSDATGEFKFICCETGKCKTCGAKCLTKIETPSSVATSWERAEVKESSPAVSTGEAVVATTPMPEPSATTQDKSKTVEGAFQELKIENREDSVERIQEQTKAQELGESLFKVGDLIEEAAKYKTWEEFRDSVGGKEDGQDDLYRKIWERSQTPGGQDLDSTLKLVWDKAVADDSYRSSLDPAVLRAAQAVGNGKALSEKLRATVQDIVKNNPEILDTPEPTETQLPDDAEDYSITERIRAARAIDDPELASKVEKGTVTEADLDTRSRFVMTRISELKNKIETGNKRNTEIYSRLSSDEKIAYDLRAKIEFAQTELNRRQNQVQKALDEGKIDQGLVDKRLKSANRLKDLQEQYDSLDQSVRDAIESPEMGALDDVQQSAAERIRRERLLEYGKGQAELQILKKQYRDTEAQRRVLRQIRELRAKVERQAKKIPKGIDFSYTEPMRLINRAVNGERVSSAEWDNFKDFLKNNAVGYMFKDDTLKLLMTVPPKSWTISELEGVYDRIKLMKRFGTAQRTAYLQQERNVRESVRAAAINTVLRGEELKISSGKPKDSSVFIKAGVEIMKPHEVALLLDGDRPGVFTEWLQDRVNEAWSETWRQADRRMEPIMAKMDELKLTLNPFDPRIATQGFLYLGRELDIKGYVYDNGRKPTVQDAMFYYIGRRNDRTSAALLQGNRIPAEIIDASIDVLTTAEKELAELIAKDFAVEFERTRQAFVRQFNMDLPGESWYIPMRRKDVSYNERREELAAELVGRNGLGKSFVARNHTFARVNLDEKYQTPIRTDLVNLWMTEVQKQEAFISEDLLVKRLHGIFEDLDVKRAIQQRFGPTMNQWIQKYINDIARPDIYAAQTGTDKLARSLRSGLSISYMGLNYLTGSKQLVSVLPFLADANPAYLVSAAGQWLVASRQVSTKGGFPTIDNSLIKFVEERSELVKHRSISREFEEIKRMDSTLYQQIIKQMGSLSMHHLEVIDKSSIVIGWKAVYDRYKGSVGEAEAAKLADKAVVRGQPSGRVQDLAQMYRSGEVVKWFTMFTNATNSLLNMVAFDVPRAIKQGHLLHAMGDLTAIILTGLGISVAAGALYGGDDEEKKKKLRQGVWSQFTDMIPLVGQEITSQLKGQPFGEGIALTPAITPAGKAVEHISEGEWKDAFSDALEATGYALKLPVSGPKRIIKALETGNPAEVLGWR